MNRTVSIALMVTLSLSTAVCIAEDFKARDLQGIRLDMTTSQVEQKAQARLIPLGRGDFKMEFNQTVFDLGFTPKGHLYRIDSDQTLGVFQPDRTFAADLTSKLTGKFGRPNSNGLPIGPICWGREEMVTDNYGTNPREVESLSAMLLGGYGQPIRLVMKMMDFRLLWRDQAALNEEPRAKAGADAQF